MIYAVVTAKKKARIVTYDDTIGSVSKIAAASGLEVSEEKPVFSDLNGRMFIPSWPEAVIICGDRLKDIRDSVKKWNGQ